VSLAHPGPSSMIRVERGAEVSPGVFAWHVPVLGLSGRSHQPLLDACRQLKSLYGVTAQAAGLFREGRDTPDLWCSVSVGAETTVSEPDNGATRFVKYRPFPQRVRTEAEAPVLASGAV
jgi:hypothetical protein